MIRPCHIACLALAALLVSHSAALAHAFPERLEAELPLGWYLAGAALAVAASFVGSIGFMRPAPAARPLAVVHVPDALARRLGRGGAVFGAALLVLLLVAGFLGPQDQWERNALPVAVWVLFWVGLLLLAALVGNIFTLINPWAALGRALVPDRCGRAGMPDGAGQMGAPADAWPAVFLLFAFAWLELAWPHSAIPRAVAVVVLAYTLFTLAAMRLYGVEAWLQRGEVFHQVFALAGRLAPIALRYEDGRHEEGRTGDGGVCLILRPFGRGLGDEAAPGMAAAVLILVLLAMVGFDGFAETLAWSSVAGAVMQPLFQTGIVGALGYTWAGAVVTTLGLAGAVLTVIALYSGVMLWPWRGWRGGDGPAPSAPTRRASCRSRSAIISRIISPTCSSRGNWSSRSRPIRSGAGGIFSVRAAIVSTYSTSTCGQSGRSLCSA